MAATPAVTDNSHRYLATLDNIEAFRVTQVASFFECPRRWKANMLGEGEQKESPYAKMGTAVHLAIEEYLEGRYDLPDGWDGVRERLAAAGVPAAEVERAREYLLGLGPLRDRKIATEYEFTVPVVAHAPAIRGHIDYLGADADGGLLIRDHKTNRTRHDAAWWSQQVQPRLYAWALRQMHDPRTVIYFEIGYVNLGEVIRWKTSAADDQAVIRTYLDMWHAIQLYQRTGDWPEFINESCAYCPLQQTCGRLKRSQADFLGALKKKQGAGWTLAQRYQWAQSILKAMQAEVDRLGEELLLEIDAGGPQVAGDVQFSSTRRRERQVSANELLTALNLEAAVYLTPEQFDQVYSVRLAALDALTRQYPQLKEHVEPITHTSESETRSLSKKKIGEKS